MREFGKRYRCIAYSARGYTPSDVPADRDGLQLPACDARRGRRARSSQDRQRAYRRPVDGRLHGAAGRAQSSRARALDDARRHRLGQRALVHGRRSTSIRASSATSVRARRLGARWPRPTATGRAACRSLIKDRARLCRIREASRRARRARLGQYLARLPRRAALALRFRGRRSAKLAIPALIVVGDEDERCIEPSLFLKDGDRRLRPGHAAEDRPCGEPGGARSVQPGGRRFSCPRRRRPLAAARSAHAARQSGPAALEPDGGQTYLMRDAKRGEPPMLKWAFVFLLIAIVAGIFGFTDVERPPPPSRNGCSAFSWCCSSARWRSACSSAPNCFPERSVGAAHGGQR